MIRTTIGHAFCTFLLSIFHFLHLLARYISSLRIRAPLPTTAKRRQLPKHLSVLLVLDDRCSRPENEVKYLQSVHNIARWCLLVGVERLSVFDEHGILADAALERVSLSESLTQRRWQQPNALPPTPPSDSRPTTPLDSTTPSDTDMAASQVQTIQWNEYTNFFRRSTSAKRRPTPSTLTLTLDIIPPQCSKPGLASAARALANKYISSGSIKPVSVPVEELHPLMEGKSAYGFHSPDLVVIHQLSGLPSAKRMYGYPPWQTHLSEICFTQPSPMARLWRLLRNDHTTRGIITEHDFRRALDQYGRAEMRKGR